jgi:hypothetical protein
LIAADEFRHFKLFYDHMRRYLGRENIWFVERLRIAASRINESEDDELAFAYHCGNDPDATEYDHGRCLAAYFAKAIRFYQYRHVERGMGMIFKAVGLPPRGTLSDLTTRLVWQLMQRRQRRFAERAAESGFAQAA